MKTALKIILMYFVAWIVYISKEHWQLIVGGIIGISVGYFLVSVGWIYYNDFIEWKPSPGMEFY